MMKKIFIFLAIAFSIGAIAQTRKVAILETVDRENALSYGVKLMVRSHLAEAVTNTPGYEAYDRTNLQQIFDEQEFQRTGYVSDEDIKKIGEMTGVQYVLVAEASKLDESNLFITAKILNVETARVEKTANTMTQTDIPSLQSKAQDLAARLLVEIKTPKETTLLVNSEDAYIERVSSDEYYIGGQIVDRKTYYGFIEENKVECRAAYQQFQKGVLFKKAGIWTASIGSAFLIGGVVTILVDDDSTDWTYIGIGLSGLGGALEIAGIPVLCVGLDKMRNAYKKYNEYCAPKKKEDSLTINLQVDKNGLGLAFCF